MRSAVFWKLITNPVARAKSCRVFLSVVVAASLAAAIISVSSAYCKVTGVHLVGEGGKVRPVGKPGRSIFEGHRQR